MSRTIFFVAFFLSLCFITAKAQKCPRSVVFRVFGGTASSSNELKDIVGQFREAVGRSLSSITWDLPLRPFKLQGDALKLTHGVTMSNKDGEFGISNPPDGSDDKFDTINVDAAKEFITFSGKRLFAPLSDNNVTIKFSTTGKDNALVKGFGAVYVHVEERRVTSATYLDKKGCVLAEQFVEPKYKGLSFLGVTFDRPIIAEVKLKLGELPLNKSGTRNVMDYVVLDDFIYSKPQ